MPNDLTSSESDNSKWMPIRGAHELLSDPAELPPTLVDPAPHLLNTNELTWPSFERLILRMAREVDDAYDPRLYGEAGQTQNGIDVVGFFSEEKPSVYQAKNYKKFVATDLKEAVEKYAHGPRPFNAGRIVVAIGCSGRDVNVQKELSRLRKCHSDLTIDFWDKEEISRLLESRVEIVRRFFGPATATAFCDVDLAEANQQANQLKADALVRGPIKHLQLASKLQEAEALEADEARRASQLYGEIAEALEESVYLPHAALIRGRQLSALERAGANDERAELALDLAWKLLASGDSFRAQTTLIGLDGLTLSDHLARSLDVLDAAIRRRRDFGVAIDELFTTFDQLVQTDPHYVDAALFVAEEAVSSRSEGEIVERKDVFVEAADSLLRDSANESTAARIFMCLADATGEWTQLVRDARATYAPPIVAWVFARQARYMTRSGKPELAADRWIDAIERACENEYMKDAATWLYSRRFNRTVHGIIGEDEHHLAQAVRSVGGRTVLAESLPFKERALASLRDEKWPDALDALNYFRWRSTILASMSDELEAHERLGDLYRSTGFSDLAAIEYVYAAEREKTKLLGSELPDLTTRLDPSLLEGPVWEQVAAFRFVSESADLIDDENARWWLEQALAIVLSEEHPLPWGVPNVRLAAASAVAALASLLTPDEGAEYLTFSEPLLERESGKYRFIDRDMTRTIVGIASSVPTQKDRALEQLLAVTIADQQMAGIARGARSLLRENSETVYKTLRPHLKDNLDAALTVKVSGGHDAALRTIARTHVELATIDENNPEPGVVVVGFANYSPAAVLSLTLPRGERLAFVDAMLRTASDSREPAFNRQGAISAIETVASSLTKKDQRRLFDEMMKFAAGEFDGSQLDEMVGGEPHPFSRMRISTGDASLTGSALVCACDLASTPKQYDQVQQRALELLRNASSSTAHQMARVLAGVPTESLKIDIAALAAHGNPSVRAVAAVHWPKSPTDVDLGRALAHDPSPVVRTSLMTALAEVPEQAIGFHELFANDPRRSLRLRAEILNIPLVASDQ